MRSCPGPVGTCHAMSPLFMLYAVSRLYGGFTSGSPCGPFGGDGRAGWMLGGPTLPFGTYGSGVPSSGATVGQRASPGGSGVSVIIPTLVFDGTYTNPVSGSAPEPLQFAAPLPVGDWIVPRMLSSRYSVGG